MDPERLSAQIDGVRVPTLMGDVIACETILIAGPCWCARRVLQPPRTQGESCDPTGTKR
jgi:hypothetical protein